MFELFKTSFEAILVEGVKLAPLIIALKIGFDMFLDAIGKRR